MLNAVLFTGALRTIKKTMKYFILNILKCSDVHVFMCVQNDTIIPNDEWERWFSDQIGPALKNIEWFSNDKNSEWFIHREKLISNMNTYENWKNYLRNSGSIIEYIQLQYAYLKMNFTEQLNGYKYDYIIRARTDSIYAVPIDFHWLYWTEEFVKKRIDNIKIILNTTKNKINNLTIISYFMSTILDQ